ncbi:Glycoside hydrolase, family 5 [Kalmanozyma brasiliensis GHG001]|uniref:Glycoside hydrolase family 5 domain-containing protein n=1 Tax=Kalmanozyma brasiliensis (strain GHG001) TaxID=1365824 RepID=V5F1V5_KALBG|nr:Glycoside hydrolase, family 5 [Kalmanozyma brasiliensis GHG001]EST09324.1 Glycoside hydrolase, family 5 [Kalmanozyma brasiliensis GHG001]
MKFSSLLTGALMMGSAIAGAITNTDAVPADSSASLDKVVLPITTANSRGASAIEPKVITKVIMDKANDVLTSTPLAGLKRHRRRTPSTSSIEPRALPPLRWPYANSAVKIRGVSLGGWLVVENFITPSIYGQTNNPHIIDEWTFGSLQPRSTAIRILQQHLNSFMSEDDIRQIAAAGLNHVRIPIGYWAFEVGNGEPFLKLNQWELLKTAVGWCAKYGLKVLIDLHAAPGNQNGFDHGGRRGVNAWAGNATNVQRTVNILQTMSREFSQPKYASSVTALELLNEPVTDRNVVLDFYQRAYEVVRYPNGRSSPPSPLLVVVGDEFINPAFSDYWNDKLRPPTYEAVSIDSHIYTIFDDNALRLSSQDRINYYCSLKPKWAAANNVHWQMVGEWTPAFTDCAGGINGRNRGSRYDGSLKGSRGRINSCAQRSGDASTFTAKYKRLLGSMWEAQVDANEGGIGWLMWTWKTEAKAAEDWSYQKGLQYGWIPRDPTKRPNGIRC